MKIENIFKLFMFLSVLLTYNTASSATISDSDKINQDVKHFVDKYRKDGISLYTRLIDIKKDMYKFGRAYGTNDDRKKRSEWKSDNINSGDKCMTEAKNIYSAGKLTENNFGLCENYIKMDWMLIDYLSTGGNDTGDTIKYKKEIESSLDYKKSFSKK